jgi:hypothetical protein
MLRAFHAAEAVWQAGIGRHPAPRADHPHAGTGAQPPHLPADATGADDAHRRPLQQQRTVGTMVELMPRAIAPGLVEPPSDVEETGQDILRHGAGIPIAARGGDEDLAAPAIPAQPMARSGRELVEPPQA